MSVLSPLLARIATLRSELLSIAETAGAKATRRPGADAWSPAEIVEHLVRAEDFGILGLWRAVEAAGESGPAAIDPPHDDRTIDEVFADLPDRVDAPEAVIPKRAGRPLGYWSGRLREHQNAIESLAGAIEAVGPDRVVLPHFVAGPLNGWQRLEFFRWHLERHLAQMRRTVGAK
ncbi:MAG: DinB family protein [Gemmatimonadetes bacterium]|nr:DinB family protein [Gemmatimonadota bacterium]NNK62122.1 DinB family protein [Gemmatimonadota bacterium]